MLGMLTGISKAIPIEKNEAGKIIASKANAERSVAYIMTVSPELFDFETKNNKIAFQDFKEFKSYVDLIGNVPMYIDENGSSIQAGEGRRKIEYNMGLVDAISSGIVSYPFGDADLANHYSLQYDGSMVESISKALKTIGGDPMKKRIVFTADGSDLVVRVSSQAHQNSWEDGFSGLEVVGSPSATTFEITTEIFDHLPVMPDASFKQTLQISQNGRFRFTIESIEGDSFKLEMFCARIRAVSR